MSINIPHLAAKLRIQSCDLFNDDGILIDDTIDTLGLGESIMKYIYNSNDSAYTYNKLSTLHTELIALCKEYNTTTEICTNPAIIKDSIEKIKKQINDTIIENNKYYPWEWNSRLNLRELQALYRKYNIPYDKQNQLDAHFESINQILIEKSACYYNSIQEIINPKQEDVSKTGVFNTSIAHDSPCFQQDYNEEYRPPFLEPLTIQSPKKYPESEINTSDSPIISEQFAFKIDLVPFNDSILKPTIQKTTTSVMTCPHCEKLVFINAST